MSRVVRAGWLVVAACGRVGFDSASIDDVSDDFDDGSVASMWSTYQSLGARHSEANGVLTITLPINADDGYAGYISNQSYDVRERDVVIELVGAPVDDGCNCYFNIVSPDSLTDLGLVLSGGFITGGRSDDGDNPSVAYDALRHRWWRIHERDTTVEYAVSPDGATWTSLFVGPSPSWIGNARVNIGGGTYIAATPSRACVFDNFNRAP